MIDEKFVLTFKASGNKLTDDEIQIFEKSAGYSKSMALTEKASLYNEIHAIYDTLLDEADEDINRDITPTYMLLIQHMRKCWLNLLFKKHLG